MVIAIINGCLFLNKTYFALFILNMCPITCVLESDHKITFVNGQLLFIFCFKIIENKTLEVNMYIE